MSGTALKSFLRQLLPAPFRRWLRTAQVRVSEMPPYGCVRFGSFRRVTPIHAGFGRGRGLYIDRYYIERFLGQNADSIRGRVLELGGNEYTLRFGGSNVTHSDILDIRPDHATATIVADLASNDGIPQDTFDCVILTQVLNFIYETRAAIRNVHRILKPGGCVLVSVAGISQIVPTEMDYCGDYWRFTRLSLRRLFEEVFPSDCVSLECHGNVLTAVAFLHGLAAEELKPEELDCLDAGFELCILLKAVKPLR